MDDGAGDSSDGDGGVCEVIWYILTLMYKYL